LVLVIYHADATPDAMPVGGGGRERAAEEVAEAGAGAAEAAGKVEPAAIVKEAEAEAELCALGFFDGVVTFSLGEVRLARRCS
jgi:hypothetical protein